MSGGGRTSGLCFGVSPKGELCLWRNGDSRSTLPSHVLAIVLLKSNVRAIHRALDGVPGTKTAPVDLALIPSARGAESHIFSRSNVHSFPPYDGISGTHPHCDCRSERAAGRAALSGFGRAAFFPKGQKLSLLSTSFVRLHSGHLKRAFVLFSQCFHNCTFCPLSATFGPALG